VHVPTDGEERAAFSNGTIGVVRESERRFDEVADMPL
jgi:hypothetical protein